MDPKNKTLIPLVIIFFLFGIAVGYIVHTPKTVTIEKPVYINNTIEKTVEVTSTPTPGITTLPTVVPVLTPQIPDFNVKFYDQAVDHPSRTIDIANQRASPNSMTIHLEDTVLIRISDTSLQNPLELTISSMNTTYKKSLGTSGAVYVTFNAKGMYNLKAVILSADKNIMGRTYAEATITIY
ncbi:MAG TPA: hypothetical protein VIO11_02520 [Candidatus Methanoperedens sp.]